MSRYWAGFVMPGCGRQSRDVGAHGNAESNSATGSCVFKLIEAIGVDRHLTSNSQMGVERRAVAPSSSCVPTTGAGNVVLRLRLAVDVRRKQPVADQVEGTGPSFRKKLTARAFGSPSIILFRSSPETPM